MTDIGADDRYKSYENLKKLYITAAAVIWFFKFSSDLRSQMAGPRSESIFYILIDTYISS